jgi:hypothetical protein
MIQELLNIVRSYISITVFLILSILAPNQVVAQTILESGELLIVSANSHPFSIDIIPLTEVSTNSELNIGIQYVDESGSLSEEISSTILFTQVLLPGSVYTINKEQLGLKTSQKRNTNQGLLVKISNPDKSNSLIAAAAWGFESTSVVSNLPSTTQYLGAESNHQYYVRNGASGTPEMLSDFVRNPEHWISSEQPFSTLGTSFQILEAPVVMFSKRNSKVAEGETATLEVSIFEHDGSRLTVDAIFYAGLSSADSTEINSKSVLTYNFTGVMGNTTYSKELPVNDDEIYEGQRTAYYSLENLSSGHLGDNITHLLQIDEDDLPSLDLKMVEIQGQALSLEVTNYENVAIPLNAIDFVLNESLSLSADRDFIDVGSQQNIQLYLEDQEWPDDLDKITVTYSDQELMTHDLSSVSDRESNGLDTETLFGNQVNAIEKVAGLDAINQKEVKSSADQATAYQEVNYWSEREGTFEQVSEQLLSPADVRFQKSLNNDEFLYSARYPSEMTFSENLEFVLSSTDRNGDENISGTEGLNFFKLNGWDSLRVTPLISAINQYLPEKILPSALYQLNSDSTVQLLEGRDYVDGSSLHALKLDTVLMATNIELNYDELKAQSELDEMSDPEYGLNFQVVSEDHAEFLKVRIHPENKSQFGYPSKSLFTNAGLSVNSELKAGLGNLISNYPLLFVPLSSSKDLKWTLSIEAVETNTVEFGYMNNSTLPEGWDWYLLDTKTGQEYSLIEDSFIDIELAESTSEEKKWETQGRYEVHMIPAKIDENSGEKAEGIQLMQNYPNPFNPVTTISFQLPETMSVKLSVFNIVGQPVSVLTNGTLPAGDHQYEWDATDLPSGMYIYQLEVGTQVLTRKMTLVK